MFLIQSICLAGIYPPDYENDEEEDDEPGDVDNEDTGEEEEGAEDTDEAANICEKDFGHDDISDDVRGHEAALIAQVIQEHSYAKIPQLGTVAQPSLVVNSQQPRACEVSMSRPSKSLLTSTGDAAKDLQSPTNQMQEQRLFDAIPKVEAVVKTGPNVKSVIKPLQKKTSGTPNCIDLTLAVTGNSQLKDLFSSFEEEINNNEQLVDWPHPVYIEDYKRLGEGEWLNTNILDFFLQHIYHQLPVEKRRNIYVYDTTFFNVLDSVDGLNQVRTYFNDINFFDKEIIAALKTFYLICSHSGHSQIFQS